MNISRLLLVNIKEEGSFYEESLENEKTPITERAKINNGPWFTLDDISPSHWRKRLVEFGAWLDIHMMKVGVVT